MIDKYTLAEVDKLQDEIENYVVENIPDTEMKNKIMKKIDELKAQGEALQNKLNNYVADFFGSKDEL